MSNMPQSGSMSQESAWVRKTIRTRWNDIFQVGGTISLIERWADDNYKPRPIPVKQYDSDQEYRIVAELDGYQSTDVQVDVRRGCLIILATRHSGSVHEQYVEVPLPININQHVAELEFRNGILTASFRKTRLGMAVLRLALAKFGI